MNWKLHSSFPEKIAVFLKIAFKIKRKKAFKFPQSTREKVPKKRYRSLQHRAIFQNHYAVLQNRLCVFHWPFLEISAIERISVLYQKLIHFTLKLLQRGKRSISDCLEGHLV